MNNTAQLKANWMPGVILIGIGLILLAGQLFQITGALALAAISAFFLAWYLGTRVYGLIVPAMIFAGLAVGVGFENAGVSLNGSVVVLGLAAGFIAIYVVNTFIGQPAHWWPLIPGGVLAIVGGTQAAGGTELESYIARGWPVLLILAGLLVLIGARRQPAGTTST